MKRPARSLVSAAAMTVLCAVAATARTASAEENNATVEFVGVYATTAAKPHCDPALEQIKPFLQRTGYNSFIRIAQTTSTLSVGGTASSGRLKNTYELRVRLDRVADKTAKVTVTWVRYEKDKEGKEKARPVQDYVQTMTKGKYQPLIGSLGRAGAVLVFFAVK